MNEPEEPPPVHAWDGFSEVAEYVPVPLEDPETTPTVVEDGDEDEAALLSAMLRGCAAPPLAAGNVTSAVIFFEAGSYCEASGVCF